MTRKIEKKLNKILQPTTLNVINESHLHSGHAGDDGSGESHFRIEIAALVFEGETRISKERLIYKALTEEMRQIHALSITILPA